MIEEISFEEIKKTSNSLVPTIEVEAEEEIDNNDNILNKTNLMNYINLLNRINKII